MSLTDFIFAGIDISSGRRPISYSVLDHNLNVIVLEKCDISQTIASLGQYKQVMLGVNMLPGATSNSLQRGQRIYTDLKKKISQAGFKPYLTTHAPKQWVRTNPAECFHALSGQTPQSRRTLGGLIQRALILYDQGLQIKDPMAFFEEITRYHLLAGIMPMELLYTATELDSIAAAYVTWMLINQPAQVDLTRDKEERMISIPREDQDWWRKKPATVRR
jgi:hypothetical protein